MLSPVRHVQWSSSPLNYSFGSKLNENILEEYHNCGSTNNPLKVLLLSAGDLPIVLPAVFHEKLKVKSVTLTDSLPAAVARNVLFLKVISSSSFDPSCVDDLQYLWSIWYNIEWTSKTLSRFLKDVSELAKSELPSMIQVTDEEDISKLKAIWSTWIEIASAMDFEFKEQVLKERYESIINLIHSAISAKPLPEEYIRPDLSQVWEFLSSQIQSEDLSHLPDYHHKAMVKEIRAYFETGCCHFTDCEIKVCINPTLLDPATKKWDLKPLTHPFQDYLNRKPLSVQRDLLTCCVSLMGEQIASYREELKTTEISFTIGDPLDLCYKNHSWMGQFHVVDTTNLPDQIGLANLLNAASLPLLTDDPRAVLLTEFSPWYNPSVSSSPSSTLAFVEESLHTTIPMILTLYGLRLVDHLLLGSQDKLVGSRRASVRLQWKRAPAYSPNIQVSLLPTIGEFLGEIQKKCFIGAEGKADEFLTPMTYAYLASSLAGRVSLNQADYDSLMQPTLVPPCELSWRTLRSLLNGEEVLSVEANLSLMVDKTTSQLRLVLASYAQARVHFIDNIQVNRLEGKSVKVTFLLASDHQLDLEETVIYLAHGPSIPVTSPTSLKLASFEPFQCAAPFRPRECSASPHMFLCREFEEFYQLEVMEVKLEDLNLLTDRKHPSEAGINVTLKTGDSEKVLTFPCPFNATEIHTSASELQESNNIMQMILMKAIYEPHPEEWVADKSVLTSASRSWDIDHLKLWSEGRIIQDLNFHLSAQFEFADLKRQIMNEEQPVTSPRVAGLRGVREIIRTLFQSTLLDNNKLFVIRLKDDPGLKSLWFLRVHPPVRTTPSGSPMLLVTANDHRLAQKFVDRKKLDQGKASEDFKRVFVDGLDSTSMGVCPMFLESDEEENLLRYLLRSNASKLWPANGWPIEDLPKGDDSPWLATFISPSYIDQAGTDAEMEDLVSVTSQITTGPPEVNQIIPVPEEPASKLETCSKCQTVKAGLKRCSRCKTVKYCSVECQRSDWVAHKPSCV